MAKVKVTRDQKKLLKAVKKNPDDSAPLAQLGWSYYEQNNQNEARHYFTQAIERHTDPSATAEAMFGMALIEFDADRYEKARDGLRHVITDYPNFPRRADVHFALAQANERLWRTAEWSKETERLNSEWLQRAFDHYEQAIERRSEQQHRANALFGKLCYDVNRLDDALIYLQRASASKDLERQDELEVNSLLGHIFLESKHDLAQARTYYETALKKGASQDMQAELHRQLGSISQQEGDDEQAVRQYERALSCYQKEPSQTVCELLVNLSELKFKHHWTQEAIQYAEQARECADESGPLVKRIIKVLAESYPLNHEYDKAVEYEHLYFDSTKDPHEKTQSLLRLGQSFEHLQQLKQAIDAYRKGIKLARRNLDSSQCNAALGRMYLHENRLNQAINHLKDAVVKATDDPHHAALVYRLLGECYAKREETEKSIDAYGVILAKYPESEEEPTAREALKEVRKLFKKRVKELERIPMSDDYKEQVKHADEQEEAERLLEVVEEILDEKGFFERLKEGLSKTHFGFVAKIEQLLENRTNVDDTLIEDLEEALILSDIGVAATRKIVDHLQERVTRKELKNPSQVKHYLKQELNEVLQGSEKRLDVERATPFFILVIGVNGTGKTTTIGKLASKLKAQGKEVLLVAGDTFRAAAIEQLEIWGERSGCEVIKHTSGADPSAVMFDAIQAAKSRKIDVVIADTAGRLHTKKNLMEELKKIVRIIARELPGAPHETLMVVDATTGQNAISQAQLFHEGVGLTGLVLTKLDGTAKGGIIAGIAHELHIPVTYIGIGEQVEDLREFHAKEFVEALFED